MLGEKLWSEGKYAAAVVEFQKVVRKSPQSSIGIQALFRAAIAQTTFLSQPEEALIKFRKLVEKNPDSPLAREAQLQIADILYSKLENYDQAIQQYQTIIEGNSRSEEMPAYIFRLAKAHFYRQKFSESLKLFRKIIKEYPGTIYSEDASFETGVTYFTQEKGKTAESSPGIQLAIDAFRNFIKSYPQSKKVVEAKFGIAACLEELDQLDAAFYAFEELKNIYPSPKVIQIKLARIVERLNQRSH